MTSPSKVPDAAPAFRLAHLSDIHYHALKGARPWHFLNKRLTGGANLVMGRSQVHQNQVTERAMDKIHAQGVDHIFITGDLTNLAMDLEFEAVRAFIKDRIGAPDFVSVIPGNHDYYTYGSVRRRRFEHFFSPWMVTEVDGSAVPNSHRPYPYVKFLGESDEVALVGVNSCVASAPAMAIGQVGKPQREALARLMRHEALQSCFRVVGLHHHLELPRHTKPHKEFVRQLRDHKRVFRTLLEGRADLVLHGHNHQFSDRSHPWPDSQGQMTICEAGSVSVSMFHEEFRGGKYNLYDLEHGPDGRLRLARVHTWLYRPEAADFVHWHTEEH